MIVICIDGKPIKVKIYLPEGVPLTATQDKKHTDFFEIKGYNYNPETGNRLLWHKRRFIPTSNIDETELLKERHGLSEALKEVEQFESGNKEPISFDKFLETL